MVRASPLLFALASPSSSLPFSSFLGADVSSRVKIYDDDCPRSNATHIVWTTHKIARHTDADQRNLLDAAEVETECIIMTRKEAEAECMKYLREDLMAFDEPFLQTMGFPTDGDIMESSDFGLENGMIGPTIALALDAKVYYSWTDRLPRYIWYNYVLNYANLNEARTNWRPLFQDALDLKKIIPGNDDDDVYDFEKDEDEFLLLPELNGTETKLRLSSSSSSVSSHSEIIHTLVAWVNRVVWTRLARHPDRPIRFVSSKTPLIFDPMSVVAFGYASCTGTSIVFVNALRAVGIPARVVGTPAWYGNATANGNHNWVEVWDYENGWKFLEPSPALDTVDTLDDDPCQRWFCHPSTRYPASRVYASRLGRIQKDEDDLLLYEGCDEAVPVPLPWQWDCQDVPGVERTQYYVDACRKCDNE